MSDLEDYQVDSSLSSESENPIQNKTVNNAINTLSEQVVYFEYDEEATAALIDQLPKAEEVLF